MGYVKINNVGISAIAAAVPDEVVDNNDVLKFINSDEAEKIINLTGIKKRRTAHGKVLASDYCVFSAQQLLKKLNWQPEEVEILIFVSQSRDYILPNTAHIIHKKLGLSDHCIVFDVPMGCSGYVYGLYIAASLTSLGKHKKTLLLAGEAASYMVSDSDKTTVSLFGDAGTATALYYSSDCNTNLYFNLQTKGDDYEALWVKGGGLRHPDYNQQKTVISNGVARAEHHLIIDGVKVFEFSISEVAKNIVALAEKYQLHIIEQADYFIMHQANMLINETIRKQLKISKEKTLYSIQNFGNTSSASIPLSMVVNAAQLEKPNSKNILLTGFGTGLSWASAYIENTNLYSMPLFEIDNHTALECP